jgi:membrane-associated phospholipid phosphatase
MLSRTRYWAGLALVAAAAWGCAEKPAELRRPAAGAQLDAVKFWEVTASTRWNRRAVDMFALRPPGNAQAATGRILSYLSIAQYRAVLAAERGKQGSMHPSVAAAVAGASVAVLSAFFPLDASTFENQLDADLAAPGWPGEQNDDQAAGEAIGRAVGAAVMAQAATDNYLVMNPGVPPVGAGRWVSSGAPIVRGAYGSRPFFLTSADQIRPGPPPAFGSPEFLAGLAEIRSISDTRTTAQIALAQFYAWGMPPFTPGNLNLIADQLIVEHNRTEREAARILAYANASSYDAHIACFDAKFAYWFIRPTQADPAITLPIPLPNHPSYPSGHSCVTGGFMYVMIDAFPSERERLEKIITDAGLSRMYGGIHYRFDVDAGRAIGQAAAALARAGSLE